MGDPGWESRQFYLQPIKKKNFKAPSPQNGDHLPSWLYTVCTFCCAPKTKIIGSKQKGHTVQYTVCICKLKHRKSKSKFSPLKLNTIKTLPQENGTFFACFSTP